MEEKKFDFWQDHSLNFLEMALKTDKQEIVKNPDGYGKRNGDCGDTVELFLTTKNDEIEFISYSIDGCKNLIACVNTLIHLVEGKKISQAWEIKPEEILNFLETLPENEEHCAELSVGTLYLALNDLNKKSDT